MALDALRRTLGKAGASLFLVAVVVASAFAQGPQTVYVTKTGTKYHRAGCTSLRSSSIPMLLAEAATKYQPCKICKPPVPTADHQVAMPLAPKPPPAAGSAQAVEAGRCQAVTKKGTQCSRRAKPGSKYCWQHGG